MSFLNLSLIVSAQNSFWTFISVKILYNNMFSNLFSIKRIYIGNYYLTPN